MVFISVTRLRIRSLFYLPQFFWGNESSLRQLSSFPGFIAGKLLVDRHWTFWTMTAWRDGAAMLAYRNSGAHRKVMPKLVHWCDEATVVHWGQEDEQLSGWPNAHRRMVTEGKVSKVRSPSPNHATRQFPEPRIPSRLERTVRAAQKP